MPAIDMDEAELVLLAMDLERQLGERALPLHEMQMIALYHPEEETRKLAGKAAVRRIAGSDAPEERKEAMLSAIAQEGKCQIEAREDAGKALCALIRKGGAWEKVYAVAMGDFYPPETRATAASDFLCNSNGAEGTAEVLGCMEIKENVREANGVIAVREALERGDRALLERIAAEKGLPQMLSLYIKSIIGRGGKSPKFGKEKVSEPPPGDRLGATKMKI